MNQIMVWINRPLRPEKRGLYIEFTGGGKEGGEEDRQRVSSLQLAVGSQFGCGVGESCVPDLWSSLVISVTF